MNAAKKTVVIRKNSQQQPTSPHPVQLVRSREEISEIAKEKLLGFVRLIVDFPEEVGISVTHGERTTVFKVDCSQRNFPKILGTKGRMISSIRNMTLAITARHGFRSIVEVPYYAPQQKLSESID